MPSSVALDVDPEEKEGTVPPTTEKGSKESTPMDLAPEEVKHGKKLESSSSKNTVRGTAAKKTSNRRNDGPDSDFTSTSPKKNAGVQMAPSDQKQKDANRRDNRYGYRHSYDNNQGGFNNQGRRQRNKYRKKPPAAAAPTRNMDSDLGSDYESDHETGRDKTLEEAQKGATFGKKRCEFNELKSSEEGKEKEKEEGEDKDRSEIDAGIGAEKIPCPKKDVLSLIPMAHQLSLNADTGGTSTLPKSSLAIKEELMQKKGLLLKKAIDPSVPCKRSFIDDPKHSADKRESSKSKLCKSSSKSGQADGIVDSVPTGNKRVHSQVLSKATNPQLPRMLSNATNARIASLKTRKDQKAAAKRAAPLKTMGIVDSSPVPSKSTKSKHRKSAAKGPLVTRQSGKLVVNRIPGTVAYMRPPKLLASLQAHDIARYRDSDRVGHSFGKPCSLA